MGSSAFEEIIVDEVRSALAKADEAQVVRLVDAIVNANRVFVGGAGRSLLMMKCFAMRLMHMGVDSHVVGETITPAIEPGDLLIVGSGSGETRTTLAIMQAGKSRGAETACITAHVAAAIPQAADLVLEIHSPITGHAPQPASKQPPGSLFEQCLLVHCEGIVMRLMARLGTTEESMRTRHTKLE